MTGQSREIRFSQILWQGIAIALTYELNSLGLADCGVGTSAHLAITAANRHPLPFTETGYRSLFVDPADIHTRGGPAAFVLGWLDEAAQSAHWRSRTAAQAQLSLF
jgi:hypothetical protein